MSTVLSEYLIERGVRGATPVYSITVIKGSIFIITYLNYVNIYLWYITYVVKYICDARVS